MPEWRKLSRYSETDGTYTVCACKVGNEWRGVLWRGKQMIAVYNSPKEAKAASYDYQ